MWRTVKLAEVVTWVRGLTYSKKDEVESNGIAVLRATNIDLRTHSIVLDEIRYISETVKVKDDKYAKVGDLLICTASGSKSHVGKVAIVEEDLGMTFGGFMAALRCNECCLPRFLYHVLTSQNFKWHLNSLGDGANINNLKFSQIENYEISLPPLTEQQRIVIKLDAAFAEIDKAIEVTSSKEAELTACKSSALDNIFQNLSNETEMGQVFEFTRGPFGGSLKKNMFTEEGFAVYEQQHAIRNQCSDFRYYVPREKYDEMSRFRVRPNAILMSCSGTIGKTTIVPENFVEGIINQALLMLKPNSKILSKFATFYMQSSHFSQQLLERVEGAAQKNVASVKVLKEILIPLPSVEQQHNLVASIENLLSEISHTQDIVKTIKTNYTQLKLSILAQELNQSEAA